MKPTDRTRNERQKRRRENERRWLAEHGFTEWAEVHKLYFGYTSLEALHTALMNGETKLKSNKKGSQQNGKPKRLDEANNVKTRD